ncbi:MAG: response regulator, partial [Pseudomonadota bacterium]|nr:response regulator [Pseudomonadota bacterium]
VKGEILQLKNTINTMVDQLNSFASEVTRVAKEVGTDGKLGGQAEVKGVGGTWKDLTDNVNSMAANLTDQVRNIADVTTAVANGDLSKKITVDVKGEILQLKNTINTMVDQLNSFASEVTRVAREVGTDGKLGGQAQVKGVAGTWKDLTDNVNFMAENLTNQVRGIAQVVTAVATGDLKRKLAVEAEGEIAELADTINSMIDTLAIFADQVTSVAREVGVEGKLGGQARVPGADGTWRDLTDNVNQLAANLTTQVRAIAEVATAVTKGDLSRSITVEAEGELAALKDNINEMIRNLRDTTGKNTEQDWLKTNLAKFSRLLQGQRDHVEVARMILSELAPVVTAQHGAFYATDASGDEPVLTLMASYAYRPRPGVPTVFRRGEGLVGQCALDRDRILLTNVPTDYIQINSGLGEAAPFNIIVLPVLFEGQVKAVLELASFNRFSEIHQTFLDQVTESIGIVLNTIAANMRTEELLKQSQSLTHELQAQQNELRKTNERLEQQAASLRESEELLKAQQEELQHTNAELQEKARLLQEQKSEVEYKNREIELAKTALEEKAEQLALTSKYKSEFLANMSHELRTPLNSLLILAKLLAENADGHLSPKEVEFARTIHASGSDLLALINDILDLSKIESGTMALEIGDLPFTDLRYYLDRTFRQVAQDKALGFQIQLASDVGDVLETDAKRLHQVLKNLLSNAFKFTERGTVTVRVETAQRGWTADHPILSAAPRVVAFSVRDTGIGIAADKQKVIFEAFQQADMTTSRKYGGTGLGLSISREIAQLLGGEIRVQSNPQQGSTFTLYVPQPYVPVASYRRVNPGELRSEAMRRPASEPIRFEPEPTAPDAPTVADDRESLVAGERSLLIVEDDLTFARILIDMAHDRGFKTLAASRGDEALYLARKYQPGAITLDIRLPDVDGWSVLDRLKHDSSTRHIPVHVISADSAWQRGMRLGARGWLEKPATAEKLGDILDALRRFMEAPEKCLLIVEDDPVQRLAMSELLGGGDVRITTAGTAAEALAALAATHFDCMVLDLILPDMPGLRLIELVKTELHRTDLPIIVYTGKDLTDIEATELAHAAQTVILKDVRSPERLLDETALFLHRVERNLPEPKQRLLSQLHQVDPVLEKRRVLVVDDDMRNIYALTSVLERQKMEVLYATDGRKALQTLETSPDVDIVLMDVMMPEMDGYETMQAIRKVPRFLGLPIIALTAKAMKGDREKCIEAGASDYIPKPVDTEQLLSLLRVWVSR